MNILLFTQQIRETEETRNSEDPNERRNFGGDRAFKVGVVVSIVILAILPFTTSIPIVVEKMIFFGLGNLCTVAFEF